MFSKVQTTICSPFQSVLFGCMCTRQLVLFGVSVYSGDDIPTHAQTGGLYKRRRCRWATDCCTRCRLNKPRRTSAAPSSLVNSRNRPTFVRTCMACANLQNWKTDLACTASSLRLPILFAVSSPSTWIHPIANCSDPSWSDNRSSNISWPTDHQ